LVGHIHPTELAIQAFPVPHTPTAPEQTTTYRLSATGAPNLLISRARSTFEDTVVEYARFRINATIAVRAIKRKVRAFRIRHSSMAVMQRFSRGPARQIADAAAAQQPILGNVPIAEFQRTVAENALETIREMHGVLSAAAREIAMIGGRRNPAAAGETPREISFKPFVAIDAVERPVIQKSGLWGNRSIAA
jgi:hypothetical protein